MAPRPKKLSRPRARKTAKRRPLPLITEVPAAATPAPAEELVPGWLLGFFTGLGLGMVLVVAVWFGMERLRVPAGAEYALHYSSLVPVLTSPEKFDIFTDKTKHGWVPLGPDKSIAQAVNECLHHGSFYTMSALPLFWVRKSTKVLVIRSDIFYAEVMVLKGPDTGRRGWAPNEYLVSKTPAK